jgi:ferric-dicitrate binding protein FerR (iron transport regulator)
MSHVRLIYKVLSGEASPEEAATLNHWIALSKDNKATFEDIKVLWENAVTARADRPYNDDDGFIRVRLLIRRRERRRKIRRIIFYVALFLVLLIFTFLASYYFGAQANTSMYEDNAHTKIERVIVSRAESQNLIL